MSLINTAGRVPPVLGTHACILHDEQGDIHHIHKVTTFEGAERRSQMAIEQETFSLAKRHGRGTERLVALHVQDFEFKPGKVYKVDMQQRLLAEHRQP